MFLVLFIFKNYPLFFLFVISYNSFLLSFFKSLNQKTLLQQQLYLLNFFLKIYLTINFQIFLKILELINGEEPLNIF